MNKRSYNGMDLKQCALFTMFIDHVGVVLIENTYLYNIESYQMLDVCLRLIGRLAFPIYAFLLVEGFLHTSSWKKYTLRMLVFALISELPFDLAAYGKINWNHQNVFFTLLIGLLVLKGIEKVEENKAAVIGVTLAGCALAYVTHVDYSYIGVLLIAVLYLLRGDHKKRCIVGGLLFAYEVTSIFAFMMIYRYNGKKGESRLSKMVFYGFYPVHLLFLWLVRNALF
ncbi:MAG: TraX family protein [bacterium]|nr:TraX family protein [bacterium]